MKINKDIILKTALNLHDDGVIDLDSNSDKDKHDAIAHIISEVIGKGARLVYRVYAVLNEATDGGFELPSVKLSDYVAIDMAKPSKGSATYHWRSEYQKGEYILLSMDGDFPLLRDKLKANGITPISLKNDVYDYHSIVVLKKSELSSVKDYFDMRKDYKPVGLDEALSMYDDDSFVACPEVIDVVYRDIKCYRLLAKHV